MRTAWALALCLAMGMSVEAQQNAEKRDERPDLYYLIVDRSASLVGFELVQPVKGAITEFVGGASPGCEIRMVLFSTEAMRPQRWTQVGTKVKGDILDYFYKNFRPVGGTRLYDTIAEAIEEIQPHVNNYRQLEVIILTDGDDTTSKRLTDWKPLCELIQQFEASHPRASVTLYSLGVDVKKKPPGGCMRLVDLPNAKGGFRIDLQPVIMVAPDAPLVANFDWSPLEVREGSEVGFRDASDGGPTSWRWDIESVGTRETRHCEVTFPKAGTFEVKLTIERRGQTKIAVQRIEVLPAVPDARFEVSPPNKVVNFGEKVTLKALTTRPDWKHSWTIAGDIAHEGREVVWEARRSGRIELVHTVEGPGGKSQSKDVLVVSEEDKPLPNAEFDVAPSKDLSFGQEVTFTARQTQPGWKHLWKIGSDLELPGTTITWTVNVEGRVEVRHTVENQNGSNWKDDVLVVMPRLQAKFEASPIKGIVPLTVGFTSTSVGAISRWHWEFADGGTSDFETPTHLYASAGTYQPRLTIFDAQGREAKSPGDVLIEVFDPPLPLPLWKRGWFWVVVTIVGVLGLLKLLGKTGEAGAKRAAKKRAEELDQRQDKRG